MDHCCLFPFPLVSAEPISQSTNTKIPERRTNLLAVCEYRRSALFSHLSDMSAALIAYRILAHDRVNRLMGARSLSVRLVSFIVTSMFLMHFIF
jgi:hypothetical protein